MKKDIIIPAAGESVTEADIVGWHKSNGDFVDMDEPIVELETDKASMDLTAESAGILTITVEEGTVNVGDVVGFIEEGAASPAPKQETPAPAQATEAPKTPSASPTQPAQAVSSYATGHPSPAAEKLIKEQGILSIEKILMGKTVALIFEKPSTRTRISFEVGMKQLGGDVITLDQADTQLGRGETIQDTVKVLGRYVDIIVYRGSTDKLLHEISKFSDVPIINGLTENSHPCQIMADILTLQEKFQSVDNLKICWVGDGNNVCNSWIHASKYFDFNLKISCPPGNFPSKKVLKNLSSKKVELFKNPIEAAINADVIITDTWVSMGMKSNTTRLKMFERFQINKDLLEKTGRDTYFLHCLPAHRGCEVTSEVIDGENSLVWAEAENRLYAHQSILLWCLKQI